MIDFTKIKTFVQNSVVQENNQHDITGAVMQYILLIMATVIEDAFNSLGQAPVISISPLPNGYRVTIEHNSEVQYFDLLNGEIPDAPSDKKAYARKGGAWVALEIKS